MKAFQYAIGFSLLEVLVSLAVVSIGALGFTKAQVNAIKSVADTRALTIANILVQDMVGRIESNSAIAWSPVSGAGFLASGSLTADCHSANTICLGQDMAAHDVRQWKDLIASSFPSHMEAVGSVCLESSPGSFDFTDAGNCADEDLTAFPVVYTIRIYWKSVGNSGDYDEVEIGTVQAPLSRSNTYPLDNLPPLL